MSAPQVSFHQSIAAPRQSINVDNPSPSTNADVRHDVVSFEDLLKSRLAAHEDALRQQRKSITDSRLTWLSPQQGRRSSTNGQHQEGPQIVFASTSRSERDGADPLPGLSQLSTRTSGSPTAGVSSDPRGAASSQRVGHGSEASSRMGSSRAQSPIIDPPSRRPSARNLSEGSAAIDGRRSESGVNPRALQRRQALEKEMGKQHTKQPTISPTSVELAIRQRVARGVASLPIEESLLLRDEQSRANRIDNAQRMAREEVPGVPKINNRSSRIAGGDDAVEVYERLYADSGNKVQHLEALTRELRRLVEANVDATFSPAITPRARNMVRKEDHTAHDDLFEQAKRAQDSKRELQQRRDIEMKKAARSRTPQVNPMSRLIASKLNETTAERLSRRPKRLIFNDYRQRTPNRADRDTLGRVLDTNGNKGALSHRLQNLYEDHARREARRVALQGERKDDVTDDCTFAPHITPFNGQSAGGASSMYMSSNLSLADRMRVWDDRRKARIAKDAKEREVESLRGCTFEPAINPPSTIVEPEEPHHGYATFIARHDRARREAEEVAAIKEGLSVRGASPTTPVRRKPHSEGQKASTSVDKDVLQRAIEALHRAKNASRRHPIPDAKKDDRPSLSFLEPQPVHFDPYFGETYDH